MKSVSIIAIALVALVALCSSAPVAETEARVDIYNDFLAVLFSGLVQTTSSTLSSFFNQLINENPLNVGKRDTEDDLAARIDFLSFFYDNILQDLFGGIVTNTFGTLSNTLINLIQTNPLNVGKRDTEGDLAARVDFLSFFYDNILQDLFGGIVTNTFSTLSNTLINLIQTNPLNVGKRDTESDLAARVDFLSFFYDNILQDLFGGIVTNTFSTLSNTLTNLIQTNPLGIGKRSERLDVNIFQFLYDNLVSDLFGGLASNTANYLQNSLNNLLNKPTGILGRRSVDIQQAQALIAQAVSTLVQQFKTFAKQALVASNDKQKLNQLVKDNVAQIKATVTQLAQQLSQLIPSTITTEVTEVLAALQSTLVYWTSGLAGSLGPVIGPFRP